MGSVITREGKLTLAYHSERNFVIEIEGVLKIAMVHGKIMSFDIDRQRFAECTLHGDLDLAAGGERDDVWGRSLSHALRQALATPSESAGEEALQNPPASVPQGA